MGSTDNRINRFVSAKCRERRCAGGALKRLRSVVMSLSQFFRELSKPSERLSRTSISLRLCLSFSIFQYAFAVHLPDFLPLLSLLL